MQIPEWHEIFAFSVTDTNFCSCTFFVLQTLLAAFLFGVALVCFGVCPHGAGVREVNMISMKHIAVGVFERR